MIHLLDQPDNHLATWLGDRGQREFHARQVDRWLFQRRSDSFSDMTDIPKPVRTALEAEFDIWSTTIVEARRAADGTEKLLLALADGQTIECVLIREGDRRTICISTQVGCAMGCVFCASGLDGVARNLTTGEILEQMIRLDRLLPSGKRLSHIVVMGMGEPLANLPRLLPALAKAASPSGLGISARRITISTVGLPEGIDRMGELGCHYRLAISLHAPSDELRDRLVPVNRRIGLASILASADRYFERTGRRLTFEYVLLGGINDEPGHARQLVALLAGRTALINVIPYNPVSGLGYRSPSTASRQRFVELLRDGGLDVQVRLRKGDSIDAACGQLRRHRLEDPPVETAGAERGFIPGELRIRKKNW